VSATLLLYMQTVNSIDGTKWFRFDGIETLIHSGWDADSVTEFGETHAPVRDIMVNDVI
jgi:hypothetical protein